MIAGHYEYDRQTGPGVPSDSNLDEILIFLCIGFVIAICFAIYDIRKSLGRQATETVEEPAIPNTGVDDDNEHDDVEHGDIEITIDPDLIIVPNNIEDGYATGINNDNVGQPRERLPERGASPRRG